jgi:hypothetical protein
MPVLFLSRQAFFADVPSAILDFLFYQICSSPVTNRLEFVFLLRKLQSGTVSTVISLQKKIRNICSIES